MNQKIYTDFGTLVLAAEYRHKFTPFTGRGNLDRNQCDLLPLLQLAHELVEVVVDEQYR